MKHLEKIGLICLLFFIPSLSNLKEGLFYFVGWMVLTTISSTLFLLGGEIENAIQNATQTD